MRVLITGAAGFIGTFLMEHCTKVGCSVLGIDIKQPEQINPDLAFKHCDVRESDDLLQVVAAFRPERVFHLAAQSYPTVSLERPAETMDINARGTINLFEALRIAELTPVTVVACSSAEYGPVAAADLPVKEDHPLRPLHPYGVSKVTQDLLSAQYFATCGLPSIRIRIFNTTGPGKLGDVCSDFTRRAVEVELALRHPRIPVGNLTTRRALLDVRDLVRALWLSSERCSPGEVYNVCGGKSYSIVELVELIRVQSGASFDLEQDPALMRSCDEASIVGDTSRFRDCTGWSQSIDIRTTLSEMLQWWRMRFASSLSAQLVRETALCSNPA